MRHLLAAAVIVVFAGSALANQCPMLWKQVDEKLQTAQLSEADKSKVMALRKQGEELHKAGNHSGSEAALNEALALLD
jgi:hypothetical protein